MSTFFLLSDFYHIKKAKVKICSHKAKSMQKYHILDYLDKLVLVCGLECTCSQNKENIESGGFHSIQEWFIVYISLNIPPPPIYHYPFIHSSILQPSKFQLLSVAKQFQPFFQFQYFLIYTKPNYLFRALI